MAADMIDILVLPGDGIGPEITAATLAVLRAAAGERLAFTEMAIGEASLAAEGSTLPDAVITAIPRADGGVRSEEHTAELHSRMRISYAALCLKKKHNKKT